MDGRDRDQQFNTTAKEYFSVLQALKAAQEARDEAQGEVERLRAHASSRLKDLGQYVGQNALVRTVRIESGEILVIHYIAGDKPAVDVFDTEGKLVG